MRTGNAVASLILASAMPSLAAAQAATTTSTNASWNVAAGYSSIGIRDLASSTPPVDASPVSWSGAGLTVRGTLTRENARARHMFDVVGTQATRFAYAGPQWSTPSADGDRASVFEGGYAYRRVVFANVVVQELDVGLGASAGAQRFSLRRQVIGEFENRLDTGIRGAGIVWARWRAGTRFRAETELHNGLVVAHRSYRRGAHGAAPNTSGGGWLTDLTVNADCALSSRAGLTVAFRLGTWTMLGAHDSYAVHRSSVVAGVALVR